MGATRGPRIKKFCKVCGVEFEVTLNSTQRFCSHSCYYKSDDRRQTFSMVAKKCHQDPEFADRSRKRGSETLTRYNKSEKGRKTSSKMGREKMFRLNKDPEFIEKRNKVALERITRLNQDAEFVIKRNNATRNSMLKRLKDPEYVAMLQERSRKTFLRLNQDPEFCKKRDDASRESMIRLIQDGSYGKAQKILFDTILELNLKLSEYMRLEKRVYLTEDIIKRYSGSNKSYYRIDIACVVNNQIILAIEVDGSMGHSLEEDIYRDKIRDSILLNEFGIKTIRVTNDQIFSDVGGVVQLILDELSFMGM